MLDPTSLDPRIVQELELCLLDCIQDTETIDAAQRVQEYLIPATASEPIPSEIPNEAETDRE